MKTLTQYILEKNDDLTDYTREIIFDIWEESNKKVNKLTSNESYQKIEYKRRDYKNNLYMDFLLGFKNNSWYLWYGRIGSVNYSDQPYKDLKTDNFNTAIMNAVTEINIILNDAYKNPYEYIQYYKSSKIKNEGDTE